MLPGRRPRRDEATRGVPLDIRDTVVVCRVHELEVGGEVLLSFGLLALEVEIEEVQVGALLVVYGGDDDEATLGRPVNGIAVLLF